MSSVFAALPNELLDIILGEYANKMKRRNGVWMDQLKSIRIATFDKVFATSRSKWQVRSKFYFDSIKLVVELTSKRCRIMKLYAPYDIGTVVMYFGYRFGEYKQFVYGYTTRGVI